MVLEPLRREVRGLKRFRLWYRHERVRDPFGDSYQSVYAYDVLGQVCEDGEARGFRKDVEDEVRRPRQRSGPNE